MPTKYPATINSIAAMLTIMDVKWKSPSPSDSAIQTLVKSYSIRVLLAIPQEFLLPSVPQAILQSIIKQKKRNERTRQQYKRKKALHVTVQSSVKEMEHTVKEVEHTEQKKPGEHVVLQRTKQVPWDGSATSLQTSLQLSWCWYAVIQWNGMAMVLVLWCGARIPRIGIG